MVVDIGKQQALFCRRGALPRWRGVLLWGASSMHRSQGGGGVHGGFGGLQVVFCRLAQLGIVRHVERREWITGRPGCS